MLLQFGLPTGDTARIYDRQTILNNDGEIIFGVPEPSSHFQISLTDIGMNAKLAIREDGVYITDLTFIQKDGIDIPTAEVMRMALENGYTPKSMAGGHVSGNVVHDYKINGFFLGPSPTRQQKDAAILEIAKKICELKDLPHSVDHKTLETVRILKNFEQMIVRDCKRENNIK